jgi:hypothetical protein
MDNIIPCRDCQDMPDREFKRIEREMTMTKPIRTLAEHLAIIRLALAMQDERGLTMALESFTFADDGVRLRF